MFLEQKTVLNAERLFLFSNAVGNEKLFNYRLSILIGILTIKLLVLFQMRDAVINLFYCLLMLHLHVVCLAHNYKRCKYRLINFKYVSAESESEISVSRIMDILCNYGFHLVNLTRFRYYRLRFIHY